MKPISWLTPSLTALMVVAFVGATCRCEGAENLLANGNFTEWKDGLPANWRVEIGSMNGAEQPVSELRKIEGSAIFLSGDSSTMAWRSVSQEVDVRPGKTYVLSFDARSKGVRLEGRQRANCYCGWMSFDAAGRVVRHEVKDLSGATDGWTPHEVRYSPPETAQRTQVILFLSQTGMLAIRDMQVAEVDADRRREVATPANLLVNGAFEQWEDGKPADWELEIGARNGDGEKASVVEQLEGGGVRLSGDSGTVVWRSLSQDLPIVTGKTYTVSVEAKAEGIRREGRQFNNCYVGVLMFDAQGKRVDMAIEDLSDAEEWGPHMLRFNPPASVAKATLTIFLSKTGELKVKNVGVGVGGPRRPFR